MLPGLLAPILDSGKELRYIGHRASEVAQTTFTFNDVPIGDPVADRLVVVGCCSQSVNGKKPSSITLAGNVMTLHQSQAVKPEANNHPYVAIASLVVAAGTTAAIVVTGTGQLRGCNILIWTITGLTDTAPFHSIVDVSWQSDTVVSLPLNIPADGIAIGLSDGGYNAQDTCDWTGLTENEQYSQAYGVVSAASFSGLQAENPRNILATWGINNTDKAGVAASWT